MDQHENGNELNRRSFMRTSVESILALTALETLCRGDLFADEIKPLTSKWLAQFNQIGSDLKGADVKGAKLMQLEWQKSVEGLLKEVDLPELLKMVEFDKLQKRVKLPSKGVQSLRFNFHDADGKPQRVVYGRQIFAMKKGRSVVPHGHNNMATAFLILKGEFQGRHYDRLEDQKEHLIIKPTIDKKFGVGGYSSVSDFKDNIHWFKALKEPAFIFNIHLLGVNPGSKLRTGRVYVDPNGEKISGGRVRARRLGHNEAHKLYG